MMSARVGSASSVPHTIPPRLSPPPINEAKRGFALNDRAVHLERVLGVALPRRPADWREMLKQEV